MSEFPFVSPHILRLVRLKYLRASGLCVDAVYVTNTDTKSGINLLLDLGESPSLENSSLVIIYTGSVGFSPAW
jgi:hypothetical protein